MPRTFLVGVKGESFSNEDGVSRQQIISKLKKGRPVKLIPDPTNEHDRWAVKVLTENGDQIGWLPSDARDADSLLKGEPISARIQALRGGTNWFNRLLGKKQIGVVLRIEKGEPDWKRRSRSESRAEQFDKKIEQALQQERSGDIDAAVVAFQQAIAEVREFTQADPHASAHRRIPVPIDRLSLALERKKQYREALDAISKWESPYDPIQPTKTVRETIRKRAVRLRQRLE